MHKIPFSISSPPTTARKPTPMAAGEGEEAEKKRGRRKPRLLCLHGFRTSGKILTQQLSKWPPSLLSAVDLIFVDAPFPSQGKSDVEGFFDPPYFEWFQFNKDYTDFIKFDECVAYVQDCFSNYGPIDGLLGFSQGAILSTALHVLQAKGVSLMNVPRIKFLVIISGAMIPPNVISEDAYSSPITCPSIHFLGDEDFLKPSGTQLLEVFEDPVVVRHPKGHTIPRLDEKGLELMLSFVERIQAIVDEEIDI